MFDADRIENRHAIGELSIIVLKSHDARPELHMPPGTLSQLVAYVDGAGNHLAVAHRYLKPDGTLAAMLRQALTALAHPAHAPTGRSASAWSSKLTRQADR